MTAFLHWLSSREGVTLMLSLVSGVWGLLKTKKVFSDKKVSRFEKLKELAKQLYHVVEHLDTAGAFNGSTTISETAKGDAKYRRFYALFRDAMRAEGLGETTRPEEEWLVNLVSRWSWLSKPCNHPKLDLP